MQNLQCSIFEIASCEEFLINTKILSLKKKKKSKTMHRKKKKKYPTNQNILFPNFTSLFQI